MKNYFKLVHFEFQRFLKLFLVLIGIIILLQLIGVFVESQSYINQMNESIYKDFLSKEQFLEQFGTFSFMEIAHSIWLLGPIMLSIAVLLIYIFFIWYRDWFGKSTFVYRLLMLPTSRLNIYLSKASVILLCTFGFLAVQLLLFPLETQILKWRIPEEFLTVLTVQAITSIDYLSILFPPTFIDFMLHYGIGITAVFVLFTAILFERSFRLKGIFYAILYCLASFFIFISPLLVDAFILQGYFYEMELFFLVLLAGLIVLAGAIWIGHYLLKNKVRV